MEFIPLLLSVFLLSAGVARASDPVLDSDGNPLQTGQLYYAQSIFRGDGAGGLKLSALDEPCPLYVIKSTPREPEGQPLEFIPENPDDDTITMGNTLYAKFAVQTSCPESTLWTLDAGTGFVTTGGTESAAIGPHSSRFAIVQAKLPGSYYQFQFCPCSVGVDRPYCRMTCWGTLGLTTEKGETVLTPNSDAAHTVSFVKVEKQEARKKSVLSSVAKR